MIESAYRHIGDVVKDLEGADVPVAGHVAATLVTVVAHETLMSVTCIWHTLALIVLYPMAFLDVASRGTVLAADTSSHVVPEWATADAWREHMRCSAAATKSLFTLPVALLQNLGVSRGKLLRRHAGMVYPGLKPLHLRCWDAVRARYHAGVGKGSLAGRRAIQYAKNSPSHVRAFAASLTTEQWIAIAVATLTATAGAYVAVYGTPSWLSVGGGAETSPSRPPRAELKVPSQPREPTIKEPSVYSRVTDYVYSVTHKVAEPKKQPVTPQVPAPTVAVPVAPKTAHNTKRAVGTSHEDNVYVVNHDPRGATKSSTASSLEFGANPHADSAFSVQSALEKDSSSLFGYKCTLCGIGGLLTFAIGYKTSKPTHPPEIGPDAIDLSELTANQQNAIDSVSNAANLDIECAISHVIFESPVTVLSGRTYENLYIQQAKELDTRDPINRDIRLVQNKGDPLAITVNRLVLGFIEQVANLVRAMTPADGAMSDAAKERLKERALLEHTHFRCVDCNAELQGYPVMTTTGKTICAEHVQQTLHKIRRWWRNEGIFTDRDGVPVVNRWAKSMIDKRAELEMQRQPMIAFFKAVGREQDLHLNCMVDREPMEPWGNCFTASDGRTYGKRIFDRSHSPVTRAVLTDQKVPNRAVEAFIGHVDTRRREQPDLGLDDAEGVAHFVSNVLQDHGEIRCACCDDVLTNDPVLTTHGRTICGEHLNDGRTALAGACGIVLGADEALFLDADGIAVPNRWVNHIIDKRAALA